MKKRTEYQKAKDTVCRRAAWIKWYKAFINRRNRRAARRDPGARDRKLDGWDVS